MKSIKFLALAMALLTAISLFAGCSGKAPDEKTDISDIQSEENISYTLPKKLTAKKIGTKNVRILHVQKGGLYYIDENNKYGVMTFDGKNKTEAKYTHCSAEGKYFTFSTQDFSQTTSIDQYNNIGLMDVNGNVLIPEEYAAISVLSDRYAKAIKVTGTTDSEDEALVFSSDIPAGRIPSLFPSDGDTLFKGEWCIYDLTTGNKVNGVKATNRYSITVRGKYFEYINDEKQKITVNASGKELPENAFLFDNGWYSIIENKKTVIYDDDDKKLFECSDYFPSKLALSGEEYLVAAKETDDKKSYVLLDRNGKVVTAEFENLIFQFGALLQSDKMIYNFKGKKVTEGTYDTVMKDEMFDDIYILKNKQDFKIIKEDGMLIYSSSLNDSYYNYDIISTEKDGVTYHYCHKDKDFTIQGSRFAPWIVKAEGDEKFTYDLIDTISGEKLLSGYESYHYGKDDNGKYYIYAKTKDGAHDIYVIGQ